MIPLKKRKRMKRQTRLIFSTIFLLVLAFTGCDKKKNEIIIAEQFGIAYAPLTVMKEMHLLEEKLPGISIQWKQFGGPTAIREGMLNGDIDIGFMGPAPVLIGIDNGMPWKFATGISFNEVAIVTDRENIHSLADFTANDRIAILSPACTQHVLLSMLAEAQLGDPHALDNQLISMSHPDATNALLADTEITAHVATPPYLGIELAAGAHAIATGQEIMGQPFTFITGVTTIRFHEEQSAAYDAFLSALEEAIGYINHNMQDAAAMLAPVYEISESELIAQMQYEGTIYSTELAGIEKLGKAMVRMGFIREIPDDEQLYFENAQRVEYEGE